MTKPYLLGSDFDGTLSPSRFAIAASDQEAIIRFSKQNIFGMISGRDPFSLRHALQQHNVPYHFLVCRGGALGYDADGTRFIDEPLACDLGELERFLREFPLLHYHFFGYDTIYSQTLIDHPDAENLRISMLQYHRDAPALDRLGSCYAVSCETASLEQSRQVAQQINEKFPDLYAVPNVRYIDITAQGVSKASAASIVRERFAIPADRTFVIGDSDNDIGMVSRFRGFAIRGNHQLEQQAEHVVSSVAEAIEIIEIG